MKKFFCALLIAVTLFAGGCHTTKILPYYNGLDKLKGYNHTLFYRNDGDTEAADPSVVTADENGRPVFYLYATEDSIGRTGFLCHKSYDLDYWDTAGAAFVPDRNSWASREFRAPAVIERDGMYYMYYDAPDRYNGDIRSIGLAVSYKPETGFTQWTGVNADGMEIGLQSPLFDFRYMPESHPLYAKNVGLTGFLPGQIEATDACPFIDEDGAMYMYFRRAGVARSEIWGLKMKDPFTPDYSTVTRLAEPGRATVEGKTADAEVGARINDAPAVLRADGRYYLTYTVGGQGDAPYAIAQAVGDSPLGPFAKVPQAANGLLLAANSACPSGVGRHCFAEIGGERFIVYQMCKTNDFGQKAATIAVDRLTMRDIGGQRVLHVNGATRTVQPLPAAVSGYKNLADKAAVTGADGTALVDGVLPVRADDGEETAVRGTVRLTFPSEVTVCALLVYNSNDYAKSFAQVDKVELTDGEGRRVMIRPLGFDWEQAADGDAMRPGSAATAEFYDRRVKEIAITLTGHVGEIVVLGKEA